MPQDTWTDQRIERLKTLWADGYSASQIADRIGGMSRNAVIGKVHRLGLAARATVRRATKPKPKSPLSPDGRRITLATAPWKKPVAPMLVAPEPKRLAVIDLKKNTCRWPIGDPRDSNFCFCGAHTDETYCAYHRKIGTVHLPRKRRA